MRHTIKTVWQNTSGAAVVEATILFPIMFMIIAALVLLSTYLPQQAVLQRATQFTATALSTAHSDSWIDYDGNSFNTPDKPANVYASLFNAFIKSDESSVADRSVRRIENSLTFINQLENYNYTEQFLDSGLTVSYDVLNFIIYKEITVTATRSIPMPVDLSFIGFPRTLDITVSSTAVVHNGDEFVRNVDIAVDFVKWLDSKFGFSDNFAKISEGMRRIESFLNI